MHPMHARSARDSMQQQHQMQISQDQDQDQQNTMTVLETLNPVQQQQQQHSMNDEQHAQVMGMIDPVQAQRQQHVVQQQLLVQQQQQQPHLHQLQPSQQTIEEAIGLDEPQDRHNNQQHPRQHQQHQQPQIISGEGIVADSGGPIVQWLHEHYEIAEGESLPRSTVYNHYLAHCGQIQMVSVNAASFGKLIRSVFVGLKTRRLGTRGHSKYHYFGVRAKKHILHELIQHHETGGGSSSAGCSRADQNDNSNHRTEDGSESDSMSLAGASAEFGSQAKRIKHSSNQPTLAVHNKPSQQQQQVEQHHLNQQPQQQQTIELASNVLYYATNNGLTDNTGNINGFGKHGSTHAHNGIAQGSPTLDSCDLADSRNHLGANWTTLVDEHWPQPECCMLDQQLIKANSCGLSSDGGDWSIYLEMFESKYRSYYKRMVELLSELKFTEVEQLWQHFWRPTTSNNNNNNHSNNSNNNGQQTTVICWPLTNQTTPNAIDGAEATESSLSEQQRTRHQQQQLSEFQLQQQVGMLTFNSLYELTSQPLIVERINQIDCSLFAAIESFLFPDMLSPIPEVLRQQIETFANNIGPCIEMAVKDYDSQFVADKSESARAFGHALLRYTKLNRLSTASRKIWEKRSSLTQLSMDLSRIDLRYIEHQVSLMTSHERADNFISGHANSQRSHGSSTITASIVGDKTAPNTGCTQRITDDGNNDDDGGGDDAGKTGNIMTSATTRTISKIATNNENTPVDENHNHHQNHNHSHSHYDHNHHNHKHHHHHNNNNNNHHHHNHRHNQPHHHLCAMQPGQLIQNFLHLLEDPYPANSWPDWCRNLFESRVCGLSMEEARNFVNEWKNYISRIENELKLRSAPSLGSFFLIKLLFDEYIDYLVVTRLAQAQHKSRAHLSSSS